jgi:hypothetical protein
MSVPVLAEMAIGGSVPDPSLGHIWAIPDYLSGRGLVSRFRTPNARQIDRGCSKAYARLD